MLVLTENTKHKRKDVMEVGLTLAWIMEKRLMLESRIIKYNGCVLKHHQVGVGLM